MIPIVDYWPMGYDFIIDWLANPIESVMPQDYTIIENLVANLFPEILLILGLLDRIFFNSVFLKNKKEKEYTINFINISIDLRDLLSLTLLLLIIQSSNSANIPLLNNLFERSFLSLLAESTVLVISIILAQYLIRYMLEHRIQSDGFLWIYGFSVIGALFIILSFDFLALFLSLELFGLSLYGLVAMQKNSVYSVEAAIKYFIQNSLASVFFIFGTSIYYMFYNTTHFSLKYFVTPRTAVPENFEFPNTVMSKNKQPWDLIENIEIINLDNQLLLKIGIFFILSSLLIKLGAAPLHFWLPDVYEGAPTITTAYLTTVVKIVYFSIFFKIMYTAFFNFLPEITNTIKLVATISMLWGAFMASKQKKIKRLLAYSSINHTGLMLFGVSFIPWQGAFWTISIYLLTYIVANLLIFIFLLESEYTQIIEKKPINRKVVYISDLNNLKNLPFVIKNSVIFAFFSLGGMPPFVGFIGKALVLYGLIGGNNYIIVLLFVISSTISIIYYSRIIKCFDFIENTPLKTKIIHKYNEMVQKEYEINDEEIQKDLYRYDPFNDNTKHIMIAGSAFLIIGTLFFLTPTLHIINTEYFFSFDYHFSTLYNKFQWQSTYCYHITYTWPNLNAIFDHPLDSLYGEISYHENASRAAHYYSVTTGYPDQFYTNQ